MPNFTLKNTLNWVDAKGYYSHTKYFTSVDTMNDGGSLNIALAAAAAAMSNADQNGGMGPGLPPQIPGSLGTQAVYGSVEDKARFTFVDAKGNLHRYEIPCPIAAIFLADGMTVDASNTDVLAFNSIMLNAAAHAYFVCSRDAEPLTAFGAGLRVRRRNQRRISVFTKSPDDVTPAE